MTLKQRLYKLDEIGFIGTQEKMSPAEREKMYRETGEYIRAHRESMKKKSQ